jgi:Arc/MetJ-type ribon-helix-helix transcriptional regulator
LSALNGAGIIKGYDDRNVMNVIIDPEYEKFIEEQVKAGRFSSSAEALEAGIARLMLDPEPDILDEQDLADIRQSIDQIERGEVVDAKVVHAEIRNRFVKK